MAIYCHYLVATVHAQLNYHAIFNVSILSLVRSGSVQIVCRKIME